MKWETYIYYNNDPAITTVVDLDYEMLLVIIQEYLDRNGHNMDGRRMIARKFRRNRIYMGPDPEGA